MNRHLGETGAPVPTEFVEPTEQKQGVVPENKGIDFASIQELDPQKKFDVAIDLIMDKKGNEVLAHLEVFLDVDQTYLISLLISAGYSEGVIDHLDQLTIDHKSLFEMYVEKDQEKHLLNNLSKFDEVDRDLVAQIVISIGRTSELFKFLSFFPDQDHLAFMMVERGGINELLLNLSSFDQLNVDQLIQTLFSKGKDHSLLSYIDEFSESQCNLIGGQLLERNRSFLLISKLEMFPEIDHNEVARANIREQRMMVLKRFIHKFRNLDSDVVLALIGEHNVDPVIATRLNVHEGLSKEVLERLFPDSLNEYFDVHAKTGQYNKLLQTLSCLKNADIDLSGKLSLSEHYSLSEKEFFTKEIKRLQSFGLHRQLRALQSVAELFDVTLDVSIGDAQENKPEQSEMTHQDRELYTQVDLSQEIIKFYGANSLLTKKKSLDDALKPGPDNPSGKELALRDRIELSEVQKQLRDLVLSVKEWMKCYLVKAVHSELKHQFGDFLPESTQLQIEFPAKYRKFESFLKKATEEEIREYLYSASGLFSVEGWNLGYGFKAWTTIAETAVHLWQEETVSIDMIWIDRAFDLQHNKGTVFDKDLSKVYLNEKREKRLLDGKRDAVDHEALMKVFKNEVQSSPLLVQFDQLSLRIDRLKDAPRRQKNSE